MPRVFTIVSIAAHVIAAAGVFVAQLLAVGPLPIPRTPVTFVGAIPIAVVEPPRPRARTASSDHSNAAMENAPPVVAPDGVAPDPPHTGVVDGPSGGVIVDGGIPGFGTALAAPPPPPPPPPPRPSAPPQPRRLTGGMRPPRRVVNADPIYPRIAQIAHVEGVVILEATIDTRGRVVDVRVLRSVPLLDQAAADAVRQWIYTPTLFDGAPVPIVMTVTVNFKLTDR
jgi:protein TonB